jgi:hypothetical protein
MVCVWNANIRSIWGLYSMRLIVGNMHAYNYKYVRPRVERKSVDIMKMRQWLRINQPLPVSPVQTKFHPDEGLCRHTDDGVRGRKIRRSHHRGTSESHTALRRQVRSEVRSIDVGLAELSLSDDEKYAAEDSGIGEDMFIEENVRCPRLSLPAPRRANPHHGTVIIASKLTRKSRNMPRTRDSLLQYPNHKKLEWLPRKEVNKRYYGQIERYQEGKWNDC